MLKDEITSLRNKVSNAKEKEKDKKGEVKEEFERH